MSTMDSSLSWFGLNVFDSHPDPGNDDAVTLSIRRLAKQWTMTILLWLVSFLLLMLVYIGVDSPSDNFPAWSFVLFVPMLTGSVWQLIKTALLARQMCAGKRLVPAGHNMESVGAYGRDAAKEDLILHDSRPLMLKFYLYLALSALYSIFAFLSQFMLYFWLVMGGLGLWWSLLPVIFVVSILLMYAVCVKTVSETGLILYGTTVLSLLMAGMKFRHQLGLPWFAVLLPLMGTEGYLAHHIYDIVTMAQNSIIGLSDEQWTSLKAAGVGLLLAMAATGTVAFTGDAASTLTTAACKLLWMLSVTIFVVVGLRVLTHDCGYLAKSRGFQEPAPLRYIDGEGWERIPGVNDFIVSPILGRVEKLNVEEYQSQQTNKETEVATEDTPLV